MFILTYYVVFRLIVWIKHFRTWKYSQKQRINEINTVFIYVTWICNYKIQYYIIWMHNFFFFLCSMCTVIIYNLWNYGKTQWHKHSCSLIFFNLISEKNVFLITIWIIPYTVPNNHYRVYIFNAQQILINN